jgi:NitT/TauT family transport system substrate-binding protein
MALPSERGTVEFVAKVYNLDAAVAQSAIRTSFPARPRACPIGAPAISTSRGMDRMIRAQKLVGALSGDVDWSKLVDTSFLPDDLKPKK